MPSVVICPSRNPRAAHFLARLLTGYPDFTVSVAPRCKRDPGQVTEEPDAVLLLTAYPDRADRVYIKSTRRLYPSACLIVLSLYDSAHFVRSLLMAGANAFVPLEYAVERLPELIRQAAAAPHTVLYHPTSQTPDAIAGS